jgi:hypothetical protein
MALAGGLLGGILSTLVMLGAALLADPGAARWGDYGALAVAMCVAYLSSRTAAHSPMAFGRRLSSAAIGAVASGAVTGLGAYTLFAALRPDLLAARFAAYEAQVRASRAPAERIARELARLTAAQAQYLDPAYQALSIGGSVCFFALLVGGFGAWRLYVARRWGLSGPRAGTG